MTTLLMQPVVPDVDRCQVRLIHKDKSESRCILARTHLDNDSDHMDRHGCHAKVLVSQSTLRELEALQEADRRDEENREMRRLRRQDEIRDAEYAISELLEKPGVNRDHVVALLREMADAIERGDL